MYICYGNFRRFTVFDRRTVLIRPIIPVCYHRSHKIHRDSLNLALLTQTCTKVTSEVDIKDVHNRQERTA